MAVPTVFSEAYRNKLRALISDPSNGILLDSTEWIDENGTATYYSDSLFELTSGSYQRNFITLWKLFDQREHFRECVQTLASFAKIIKKGNAFSSIVTCTETSKHLLDNVHSYIENLNEPISIHYLGHYPYLNLDNRDMLSLKGERVLIFTDVVATGTLIKSMARLVEKLGGQPVAVLCVALTNVRYILQFENEQKLPIVDYDDIDNAADILFDSITNESSVKKKSKFRIHFLTDYPIDRINTPPVNLKHIRKIDPITVFPELVSSLQSNFKSKFSLQKMFTHFEEAEAIDFNFYERDNRRFTTAIRIDRVLDFHHESIWQEIKPYLLASATYVTTFNREDIQFKEFIEDKLGTKLDCIFIPRKDALEAYDRYFLLDVDSKRIKEKTVILLLSTVHTSEKIRSLAALLASYSVKEVHVVCLLSRMGRHTSNFMSRIDNLLKGSRNNYTSKLRPKKNHIDEEAPFTFHALYSISDFSSEDIYKMQQIVFTLFEYYKKRTQIPGFKRRTNQYAKYFQSNSLTTHRFQTGLSNPLLTKEFSLKFNDDELVSVKSQEGKFSLLCSYIVETRNYKPVIDEIRNVPLSLDKDTLFTLFAIVLADTGYLKTINLFRELRSAIIETILICRRNRFLTEDEKRPDQIDLYIDLEMHLVFGLSLFSYLDQEYDYQDFIISFLTCDLTSKEWLLYRHNLVNYLGDERTIWNISLLIYMSHPNFNNAKQANDLKKALTTKTLELKMVIQDFQKINIKDRKIITNNLNLLLSEISYYKQKERHHVLRFLLSKIIYIKDNHNPILTSIDGVIVKLVGLVFHMHTDNSDIHFPFNASASEIQKEIESATYHSGVLEQIANAVHRIVDFVVFDNSVSGRFSNGINEIGFARDVKEFGDILEKIRINNTVTQVQVTELQGYHNRIRFDLTDSESALRKTLLSFIVDLRQSISHAMKHANEELGNRNPSWGGTWQEVEYNYKGPSFVLMDPFSLKEILRNIFSNASHAAEITADSIIVSAKIHLLSNQPTPDAGEVDYAVEGEEISYWELEVVTIGGRFSGDLRGKTLEQHQLEVRRYGGELSIQSLEDLSGVRASLRLLARKQPPKNMLVNLLYKQS